MKTNYRRRLPKGKKEETEQCLLRDHDTNLVRIFQFISTPLDATVCCHQDDELSTGWFPDLEGLCVEGLLEGLHADEVLEFEVASCGPTLAELLDEALEAEADSLACQEVAVLDLSSHVLWQERLVARSMQEGIFFFLIHWFLNVFITRSSNYFYCVLMLVIKRLYSIRHVLSTTINDRILCQFLTY